MKKAGICYKKKKKKIGINTTIDEFQNKINFLLILINIIHHNIVYIHKLVKYKKKDFSFNIFTI